MHVIGIWNEKGGVAKTTTVVNVAAVLVQAGYRVVCVDTDPSGSLTKVAGLRKAEIPDDASVWAAMLPEKAKEPVSVAEMLIAAPWGGEVLPVSLECVNLESDLAKTAGPIPRLRRALDSLTDSFDFAVVDCGAGRGPIAYSVLFAADSLFVPVQLQKLAADSIEDITTTIDLFDAEVLSMFGRRVPLHGVFGTFAEKTIHCREVTAWLIDELDDDFLRVLIPKTTVLADAAAAGEGAVTFDPDSDAARRYVRLTTVMLERGGELRAASRVRRTFPARGKAVV